MTEDGSVRDEVSAFKKEVDAGFDRALVEVTEELAAVSVSAAIPLPGLEPAAYPDPGEDVPFLPQAEPGEPNPLQEELFASDPSSADDGNEEDAIVEFAPDPAMNWGPRRLKLPDLGAPRDET